MKIVNFKYNSGGQISAYAKRGLLINDYVISLSSDIYPDDCNDFFKEFNINKEKINSLLRSDFEKEKINLTDIELLSPIIKPNSLRDAYAFRKHVEAGRKSRNLSMIPEYDDIPVYYYGNHNSVFGPGEVQIQKELSKSLDYELEIAAIIGRKGKNIKIEDADDYILGYTIMNDFSARQIQKKEMKMSLGPAKGKDFLTCLGPFVATKDELKKNIIKDSCGARYDLKMEACLNGKIISEDNFKNITWTFAQIISQISMGTSIYPGDVIGSGTCATGCLLEINQTNNTNLWLKDGDEISLSVDGLGTLTNTIIIK